MLELVVAAAYFHQFPVITLLTILLTFGLIFLHVHYNKYLKKVKGDKK